jgi:hypothetical protein
VDIELILATSTLLLGVLAIINEHRIARLENDNSLLLKVADTQIDCIRYMSDDLADLEYRVKLLEIHSVQDEEETN